MTHVYTRGKPCYKGCWFLAANSRLLTYRWGKSRNVGGVSRDERKSHSLLQCAADQGQPPLGEKYDNRALEPVVNKRFMLNLELRGTILKYDYRLYKALT